MRGVKDIQPRCCKQCGATFYVSRNARDLYCSKMCSSKAREKNLQGKTFGNLEVIKRVGNGGNGIGVIWLCKCKCGKLIERTASKLINGDNQSCGCIRRKNYGLTKSKFYSKYNSIRSRCEKPSSDSYLIYGGRGIKCERKTFQEFYKDMYESYLEHCNKFGEAETTIDRINNDGNYCKENCRWATNKEQSNNRTNNRIITYNGDSMTLTQRAERIGITRSALTAKLNRGVPMERIVKFPHKRRYSHYDIDNELKKYS